MKKMLFVLFIAVISANDIKAQQPVVVTSREEGWHKIGDATVDFRSDKDKFIILGRDRFKAVQIKVMDAPLKMDDMQIKYDGGGREDIALRSEFQPGSESRIIDLKNNSAKIKNVTFVYHTIASVGSGKARIELWGLK
ncbi:MAG: hypothetical protein ABJA78_16065 [Ferruginibacter sp.]